MENEQKEHLLSPEEAIHNDDEIVAKRQKLHLPRLQNPLLLILLLVSFGFNVFLFSYQFVKHNRYLSHNAGLEQDAQLMQRWRYTAYSHPNETLRNEAWASIDIDRTIVAIDRGEAAILGLPPSTVFPWDSAKDIYAISAYHQFHCLKILYGALQEAHHGKPFSWAYSHILHCLDTLRGDFKCIADDFIFPVGPGYNSPIGEGEFMRCRDFSKLDKWTIDHHSCFKYIDINDDTPPTEMHQWRNCPEHSPYTAKMRDYFGYGEDWVPEFNSNHGPEFPPENEDRVENNQ